MSNAPAAPNDAKAAPATAVLSPLTLLSSTLIVLAIVCGLWALRDFRASSLEIDRDHGVVVGLERLLSTLKDLETGQRGYLLTGREDYLEPYTSALTRLDGEIHALESLGLDTGTLARLVAARRDNAAMGLEIYRAQGRDGLDRIQIGRGKASMDAVRAFVAEAQEAAETRTRKVRATERRLVWPLAWISAATGLAAFAMMSLLAVRRRNEQRASNALFQGVLENAPVGLGFLDRSLYVRHMNRALSTMSDRALSAGVGTSIWEVVPHMRTELEARLNQVVEGGRPISNIEIQAGSNLRSDQVRDYQVSFYPLRSVGRKARIEGAGMVVSDITARKRMERWLRESEERFRTLTEASAAIIWTTDAFGEFDARQKQWTEFTGQAAEAAAGHGYLDSVHDEDRPETTRIIAGAIAAKSRFSLEHRLRRADGAYRYMAVSAVPILDEDGAIRQWVGMHSDITDRKLAEIELSAAKDAAEAANRAKSAFLANMSHELRTPLSAVIGYSEMMEEEIEDLGERTLLSDLGKIKSNARHLLSLINDVLDLSKIEANRMDTFAEPVDVETLIREVAGTVETLVKQKGNTLVIDLGPELGGMHTDVVKLRQCLFNLLSNASKFTENGRIIVEARRQGGSGPDATLVFRLIDSGIGMTQEQLSRLFQRFSQADETTTRKFGGTGLGLAITKAFCRLLGGDIEVESTFGAGTTFTMRLPAAMPEQAPRDPDAPLAREPHPAQQSAVLVIDDDAAQRDLMVRFLERQGFSARTAADGLSGLELARTINPRAILLDVMMPQMDGWSVLSALKADPDLAKIPVIMVTFVDEKGLSASLGAADHVSKPVNWDRLKSVLDRLRESEGDVLVVDDDADIRDMLRSVLERSGWTAQEAGNGQAALDKVILGPPRAILLDLMMPVMDGFAFLHALRERPGCADIPVIVFSARNISAEDREQLRDADRVFSKTASLRDITGELRALAAPMGAAVDLAEIEPPEPEGRR